MKEKEFISEIAKLIKKCAPAYDIRVNSPIIAQAILESGFGESKLSAVYHNYFGLKCGTAWKGKSVNMKTQEEYTPGTKTTIRDNFRVYGSMEEGVRGYFEFIQMARYRNLKGITDPKKYLETIIKAENAPTFEDLGAIEEADEQAQESGTEEPEEAPTGLTISLPRKDLSDEKLKDLQKLLRAKEDLIKKALDADRLTVEITEDQISFPWFDRMPDADEIKAYMHFITALIKLVKKSKRVTATRKNVDNEKYTFRCLLLRLGFIGDRSKKDRKILLKNLSGSSAFRKGGKE